MSNDKLITSLSRQAYFLLKPPQVSPSLLPPQSKIWNFLPDDQPAHVKIKKQEMIKQGNWNAPRVVMN